MNILITGDFCPLNRASETLEAGTVFKSIKNIIEDADIAITNLECPLTTSGDRILKTGPALKAHPKYAEFLKKEGFGFVTLANNHIMDYGSKGLIDTIAALELNNIEHIGAGKQDNDIVIAYKTLNGVKVAIVNICENEWSTQPREGYSASGFSEINSFYAIQEAKQNAHHLIVIHHGGHEMYNLPSPRLKKTLRYFVDCGADVVINHHTHCIGGTETYHGKPIFYSLGNFVFDSPLQRNSIWNYGMAVSLVLTESDLSYKIHYFEQCNTTASVKIVEESALPYDVRELDTIIQDETTLIVRFEALIDKRREMYNTYLEPVSSKFYNVLKRRGLLPSLWTKRKRLYLKNLISCESHREIVEKILQKETSKS